MLSGRTFTGLELDDKDTLNKSPPPSMKDAGEAMFTMEMRRVLIFYKIIMRSWTLISAQRMSPFYAFSLFLSFKFYF